MSFESTRKHDFSSSQVKECQDDVLLGSSLRWQVALKLSFLDAVYSQWLYTSQRVHVPNRVANSVTGNFGLSNQRHRTWGTFG